MSEDRSNDCDAPSFRQMPRVCQSKATIVDDWASHFKGRGIIVLGWIRRGWCTARRCDAYLARQLFVRRKPEHAVRGPLASRTRGRRGGGDVSYALKGKGAVDRGCPATMPSARRPAKEHVNVSYRPKRKAKVCLPYPQPQARRLMLCPADSVSSVFSGVQCKPDGYTGVEKGCGPRGTSHFSALLKGSVTDYDLWS